jgi:rsbT co-antagonist protein RsbR
VAASAPASYSRGAMDFDKAMKRLSLDERELESRRAFFGIEDEDLDRLRRARPLAEKHMNDVIEQFYAILLGHGATRKFFPDDATVRRVKELQRRYFLGLFEGRLDLEYVRDRLRVGAAHQRVGLPTAWYLGAFAHYLRLTSDSLAGDMEDAGELAALYRSLQRIIFFDTTLAIDMYMRTSEEAIDRHQLAIRELSTPVIRLHDRVLLLPLVGTIDSHRAHQVMERVLVRVVEEQARVIVLDIAGVPVVDTQVADHLLRTTAAVKLLGAETVLTGIGPQIARTVVELGVDISAMHTRSRLDDGLELALSLVGRRIVDVEDAAASPAAGGTAR